MGMQIYWGGTELTVSEHLKFKFEILSWLVKGGAELIVQFIKLIKIHSFNVRSLVG